MYYLNNSICIPCYAFVIIRILALSLTGQDTLDVVTGCGPKEQHS